jgi:hypothetical protein
MKTFLLLIGLASGAAADDWTAHLSPRLREAFKTMVRDDWKPQRAAELTPQEKREWTALWEKVQAAPAPPPLSTPPPGAKPQVEGK